MSNHSTLDKKTNYSNAEEELSAQVKEYDDKNICRDYLRNICQRGRRCKYKHPTLAELEDLVDVSDSIVAYEFCHDFQNNQCQRINCRFIHCSSKEEEAYNSTKKIPLKLKLQFEFGISDCFIGSEKSVEVKPIDSKSPICRDFLNRECYRGKKCKFLHLEPHQASQFMVDMDSVVSGVKRPRIIMDNISNFEEDCKDFPSFTAASDVSGSDLPKRQLAEENMTLKKRVQELEKQVSDLAATNEVLLEQNAQFRFQKRGVTSYGMASEPMTSTFKPTVGITNPANIAPNVVGNTQPQGMPVQLSVQVTGQPGGQDLMNGATGQPPPQGARLQQVPVSLPQTTDITAQVIAANLAANTGNNVDSLQATNQIMIAQQANLTQIAAQPIASFPAPVANPMAQQQQQAMGSFAGGVPTHNQLSQQPVSFAGTIMAAALAGGRCAIQAGTNAIVTPSGEVHQSSMGHAVQLPPMVYTVTRSTGNVPLASTVVSGTGHEITLVADTQRNPASSMPGSMHPSVVHPATPFNNVSPGNQGIVQASSHQNTGMPRTSGIAAINTSMPQSVSRGAVRNNLAASPQVNAGSRPVVPPGAAPLNEQGLISYPIAAVQSAPLHN